MRCRACDIRLKPHELVIKNTKTKQFEDLCTPCLRYSLDDNSEVFVEETLETITVDTLTRIDRENLL
jgi:hypothetical protein